MQFLNDLYPWLSGAAGGLLGAAFLLPTRLGEALFKYRFDRAVEGFKAEQAHELERLREQLNHYADRGKRSNEMEFTAISSIWGKFVEAYLATATCAIAHVEYPDFTRMSEPEKHAFISGSKLSDTDQERLRKASDQNKEYVAVRTWQQIAQAGRAQHELRLMIRKQRIFTPRQLSDQFMNAVAKLTSVYVQRKLAYESPGIHDAFGGPVPEFLVTHEAMFDQLCASANARLFRDEAA